MTETHGDPPHKAASQPYDIRSWWFRRIAVTLAIGNAAGVIALGGLVGDKLTVAEAAPVIFRPLPYFLSGTTLAMLICALQFFFSLFDMDGRIRRHDEHIKTLRLQGKPRNLMGFDWVMLIYAGPITLLIILSAIYFYIGSRMVVEEANISACAAIKHIDAKASEAEKAQLEARRQACISPRPIPLVIPYPEPSASIGK